MDELTEKNVVENIKKRIAELEKSLNALIEDTNKQIFAHQAVIGELKAQIEPPKKVEQPKEVEEVSSDKMD